MNNDDWGEKRVVFVCSGNICRSPMAAELTRLLFEERGWHVPRVVSLGTLGIVGSPAHQHAITAIEEIGGNLSGHSSQGLNPAMLGQADYIFGMEARHLDRVRAVVPALKGATALLSQYGTELEYIWDPVSGGLQDFRDSRDLITLCIDEWLRSFSQERTRSG